MTTTQNTPLSLSSVQAQIDELEAQIDEVEAQLSLATGITETYQLKIQRWELEIKLEGLEVLEALSYPEDWGWQDKASQKFEVAMKRIARKRRLIKKFQARLES